MRVKNEEMERRLALEQQRILEHNKAVLTVNSKESEIRDLLSKTESLNEELGKLRKKLKEKKTICQEQKAKIEALEKNVSTLVFSKKSLEVQFNGKEIESKARFEEQMRNLSDMRAQMSKAEKKRVETMSENHALKEENKKLLKELEAYSKAGRATGSLLNGSAAMVPNASFSNPAPSNEREEIEKSGGAQAMPASSRSGVPQHPSVPVHREGLAAMPVRIRNSKFEQGTIRVYYSKPFFTNVLSKEETEVYKNIILNHGGDIINCRDISLKSGLAPLSNSSGINGVLIDLEFSGRDQTKTIRNISTAFIGNPSLVCKKKPAKLQNVISPNEKANQTISVFFGSFPYRLLELEVTFRYRFPFNLVF